jgi:chromosomal replication initiation ATPase DnaA
MMVLGSELIGNLKSDWENVVSQLTGKRVHIIFIEDGKSESGPDILSLRNMYDNIEAICLEDHGLSVGVIQSRRRKREYINCCKMIVACMLYYCPVTLKFIGDQMGGRDHSTILTQRDAHYDHLEVDAQYRKQYERCKDKVRVWMLENSQSRELIIKQAI